MADRPTRLGPIDRSQHEILVVDDNPASRYATSRLLRSVGFRTREAATGSEALQMADRHVSAMVLDVHLPDIDGFEICRIMRARAPLDRLPVVHLTAAYVTDDDKVRSLDSGADAYLTRPVEPAVIVATVQALVRARLAEDAMHRSEAKFRAIYANAPTGIAVLDADGRLVELNPAMRMLLGREPQQATGRRLSDYAAPEWAPRIDEWLQRHLKASATTELQLQDGAGDPTVIEFRIAPLGEADLRLVIATDVSARAALERARLEVLEREQAARGEAERVSRLKDELIAVLSHELRSPLNAIMGWAHVLRLREPSDEMRKGIDAIERNGRAQARLLSDILDVSRLGVGKLELELQVADPAQLLRRALDEMQPTLTDAKRTVRLDIGGPFKPVLADAGRLQQVVWNLLSNAIKFSPADSPIDVSLHERGDGVRLSVADRGKGIDPQFLPHLFERFSQADARANRSHGGLGLGLAIVDQLVRLHGGRVSAFSEGLGKGAVLHVDLPYAKPAPSADAAQAGVASVEPAPLAAAEMGGMSVLIVDDDAEACATLAMILGDRGAVVRTAASFESALQALHDAPADLLISDIGMPGRNGLDLMREVRRLEQGGATRTPAIALTAFTRPQDVAAAMDAGFDAHCGKPLQPAQLLNLVGRIR